MAGCGLLAGGLIRFRVWVVGGEVPGGRAHDSAVTTLLSLGPQVKSGTIFDNIFVGDNLEEAKKFAEDTWGKIKDGEKEMSDKVNAYHSPLAPCYCYSPLATSPWHPYTAPWRSPLAPATAPYLACPLQPPRACLGIASLHLLKRCVVVCLSCMPTHPHV